MARATATTTAGGQRPSARAPGRLPWQRFIGSDACVCSAAAPCLGHFDDLDWRDRELTRQLVGITPPIGR